MVVATEKEESRETKADPALVARAERAISVARSDLVLATKTQTVFFATLAMRMQVRITDRVPTMAVDGVHLFVNPEFTTSLTREETYGVLAHEVMHNALKHHCRRENRDPMIWNVSCDLAVNHALKECGVKLPKCALYPGEGPFKNLPEGKHAEWYYAKILEDAIKIPMGGPGGAGDPGGCGGVLDAPGCHGKGDFEAASREMDVQVAQAHQVAKRQGTLPGGLDRLVAELFAPKVCWADVLKRFVNRVSRNDFSWSRPNRRFVSQGWYFPGLRSEELGHVVAFVDTSGSISGPVLSRFASELEGILTAYDCQLTIVYHDSEVAGTQTWKSTDGPLKMVPKGGGGTDHRPAFDWVNKNAQDLACLVCLTDLYTTLPDVHPEYPVLWAVVGNDNAKPPFGETLFVE